MVLFFQIYISNAYDKKKFITFDYFYFHYDELNVFSNIFIELKNAYIHIYKSENIY